VEGDIQRSTLEGARLAPAFEARMERAIRGELYSGETVSWSMDNLVQNDLFTEFPLRIPAMHFNGPTTLSGYRVSGPMIIQCTDTLTIDRTNDLDMVLLKAPFIRIEPDSKISAQCFASEGIEVGDRATLMFPSLLAVWRDEHRSEAAMVHIGSDATVQGAVVVVDRSIRSRTTESVKIATGARVEGEVHAEGSVELLGTVKGRLSANGLTVRTPSSMYRGYLLDGAVERADLPFRSGFGCAFRFPERTILQCRELPRKEG
jgi:hypothetical protein